MTQGRAARVVAQRAVHARRRPLLRDAAVPRQRAQREPVPRAAVGRDDRAAPQVLGVGVPARRAALRRDVLQHRRPGARPHPRDARDRPTTATTRSSTCSGPRPRRPTCARSGSASGRRCSRATGRARTRSSCPARPGAAQGLARPPARRRSTSWSLDPATGEEKPRARFDEHGRLLNAGEAIGELVEPQRGVALRGLLQQPRSRRRAHPQRLVLVGRPRLPRRRGRLLLRRPQRRLAARRRRELRRRAGRAHPRPVPRRRRRRRVRRARQPHRRPGDGGARAAGRRRRSTPTRSPRSSPSSPTSAPSGRRATCASSTRCRSARPTRSTSARCAPSAGRRPTRVFWRRPRAETYEPFTPADAAELRAEFDANQRANLLE